MTYRYPFLVLLMVSCAAPAPSNAPSTTTTSTTTTALPACGQIPDGVAAIVCLSTTLFIDFPTTSAVSGQVVYAGPSDGGAHTGQAVGEFQGCEDLTEATEIVELLDDDGEFWTLGWTHTDSRLPTAAELFVQGDRVTTSIRYGGEPLFWGLVSLQITGTDSAARFDYQRNTEPPALLLGTVNATLSEQEACMFQSGTTVAPLVLTSDTDTLTVQSGEFAAFSSEGADAHVAFLSGWRKAQDCPEFCSSYRTLAWQTE